MITKDRKELHRRLGKFIRIKREEKGITLRKLASMIGSSYQTISNWELAKTSPSRRRLRDLIIALDIDIEEIKESDEPLYVYIRNMLDKLLQEESDTPFVDKQLNTYEFLRDKELERQSAEYVAQLMLNSSYKINEWVDIPVFASVSANFGLDSGQDMIGTTRIPREMLYGNKRYFGLRIDNDRNSPLIMIGDILIVEITEDVGNDEYVVFHLNGSDARVGKYYTNRNKTTIEYMNEHYKNQDVSVFDKVTMLGVVRELKRRFA